MILSLKVVNFLRPFLVNFHSPIDNAMLRIEIQAHNMLFIGKDRPERDISLFSILMNWYNSFSEFDTMSLFCKVVWPSI